MHGVYGLDAAGAVLATGLSQSISCLAAFISSIRATKPRGYRKRASYSSDQAQQRCDS